MSLDSFKKMFTRTCLSAGSLALVLLIGGCSSTPMTKSVLHDDTSLATPIELQQTPFFPQEKYQCGPAALATVLNFYDHKTQPEALIDKVYIPEKKGSIAVEMVSTARSYERLAYPLDKSLESLLKEVEAGNPVLVMQNLAFNWWPQWHYAVVVGYDLDKKSVTLRSGTEKRHIIPFKTFERTWRRANYWALVIVPPSQVPATAQAPRYLKAAQDLEATGHTASALQAYQSASKKWPHNALPWLALGNSYYAQGDFRQAEQNFRQGIKKNPETAELWNNLGYSLMAQQCRDQAIKSAQCAVTLQSENSNYHDSLKQLMDTQAAVNKACKPVICDAKIEPGPSFISSPD